MKVARVVETSRKERAAAPDAYGIKPGRGRARHQLLLPFGRVASLEVVDRDNVRAPRPHCCAVHAEEEAVGRRARNVRRPLYVVWIRVVARDDGHGPEGDAALRHDAVRGDGDLVERARSKPVRPPDGDVRSAL